MSSCWVSNIRNCSKSSAHFVRNQNPFFSLMLTSSTVILSQLILRYTEVHMTRTGNDTSTVEIRLGIRIVDLFNDGRSYRYGAMTFNPTYTVNNCYTMFSSYCSCSMSYGVWTSLVTYKTSFRRSLLILVNRIKNLNDNIKLIIIYNNQAHFCGDNESKRSAHVC